jgi:hypothetical protein
MYLQPIKSVEHNAAMSVNRSILKKSRHVGFGVFIVHSTMCCSFYQEIDLSTYFRWIVDDQNMLEASDLHSCPPSVQRPVISAPFYNSSRMSLNVFVSFGSIHIVLSDILRC